jgi:hypothetical protein
LTVLGGCSSKQLCPQYSYLKLYPALKPIKLKIIQSKGTKEHIHSLEKALTMVVSKSRKQQDIIKAYEQQVINYNKWLKEHK